VSSISGPQQIEGSALEDFGLGALGFGGLIESFNPVSKTSESAGQPMPWAQRITSYRPIRYLAILGLDGFFSVASLYLAFFVRFEGKIPVSWSNMLALSVPILVMVRTALTLAFGLHRWSFRLSGLHEAIRLALATLSGSACFVAVFYFLRRPGPPRSVILLEFFLTTSAMAVFRFTPRLASALYADQNRFRRHKGRPTLIVGAGSAGDLLLRDLLRSNEHDYHVVGFVDDDRRKIGHSVGGKPVLGGIDRIPALIERYDVTQVLIAVPRLSTERIQTILSLCSSLKVHLKIIPVSFTYLKDRVTAGMLHDLTPEDLLPRDETVFDSEEIRSMISGRRILITGAAGSIGSEMARQISACGPESLVLVDINENDLYFLYRELREIRPDLKVFAEVANIREESRIQQLGSSYQPHYVFHAAAHKHVPLMEHAPEEAIQNNIFGTWNVARMAERIGAERFVLVSTDKAVHPASVMGVTKRVAELIVRDIGRTSSTRFTAVRFGNVLGSAGSVVPLFKRQIERGGPVTVTHPECTRYFMTIPEAVGLVLLAGLGDYGDLCILEMGKPMRIADLASHMITMAGRVPGVDIRIEFTGLRPGEKLTEALLTDEEEKSRVVRHRISVASSPPPPADLVERLEDLRQRVAVFDRPGSLALLKALVPTFQGPLARNSAPLLEVGPTASSGESEVAH